MNRDNIELKIIDKIIASSDVNLHEDKLKEKLEEFTSEQLKSEIIRLIYRNAEEQRRSFRLKNEVYSANDRIDRLIQRNDLLTKSKRIDNVLKYIEIGLFFGILTAVIGVLVKLF